MAQTISATDVELLKPVNVIMQETFLRQARPLCPHFAGAKKGELMKNGGTATVKWRRVENVTPTTTALSELTTTASYMQGRDSVAASVTDVTAAVSKYGQFYIVNEEVDLYNPSRTTDELVATLGISAGRSLNQLQRNVTEDNFTKYYANSTSDGGVNTAIDANDLKSVINTLDKNSAMPFMPMSNGSVNVGTLPILPAYWGICHPDVALDIAGLTGFVSVEKYAGQVAIAPGEFGLFGNAGTAVRFVKSPDASIDANAGSATLNGMRATTANVDLYTTVIYGQEAHGSVGLGKAHTDGIYRGGDAADAIELIAKGKGSGGTSDPFSEISTLAWKAFHGGTVLNSTWGRAIRSGATNI